MTDSKFTSHHVALSVRSREASEKFYRLLGFMPVLYWEGTDNKLTITHMKHTTGLILELFAYADNASMPKIEMAEGNDLARVGLKHIAVKVDNLKDAREALAANGYATTTPDKHGRTQIDFFFVQDPDGLWVEVVHDVRSLDERNPIVLKQE